MSRLVITALVWGSASSFVKVAPPSASEAEALREGAVLIGFLAPLTDPDGIERLRKRGVTAFAMESMVDELAHEAKQDPLAYRVALLDKNPRAKAVLQIAAEKSGWGKPLPAGLRLAIALGEF